MKKTIAQHLEDMLSDKDCHGEMTGYQIQAVYAVLELLNYCGYERLCELAKDAIEEQNTRQAPPIGRCDDCNHRYENELNEYVCEILDISSDDNFYCSYFEPKGNEENGS